MINAKEKLEAMANYKFVHVVKLLFIAIENVKNGIGSIIIDLFVYLSVIERIPFTFIK